MVSFSTEFVIIESKRTEWNRRGIRKRKNTCKNVEDGKLIPKKSYYSLTLDGAVNVTNKEQSSTETNSTKHQEETVADASHVPKEKRGLHES